MEDNKKDYSDFFSPRGGENSEENKEFRNEEEAGRQQEAERPSYYYSYGPSRQNYAEETTADSSNDSTEVEVTAPRPVRTFMYNQDQGDTQQSPNSGWKVSEPRKRTSIKSVFAAFMAGAVLMGGLMFASDRYNLFTGDSAGSMGGGAAAPASGSPSSPVTNGLKGASLDIDRPGSVSSIVKQASPAVVKIDTYATQKRSSRSNSSPLFDDPFFRYFFGDDSQGQQQAPQTNSRQALGMGSGFIFEKSGYILTNQHVVEGADEIEVTVEGYDKPFKAKLLGNSFDLDLAVLKIEGTEDFPVLPIGDSNQMGIGDWVVAIGNPYGFDHTVTVGVLSAREREIQIPEEQGTRNYKHLFQTDASINPGNSGGPLLNMNGEVVGINTAVNSQAQGIGFAIPTSTITEVLDNLKNNVKIPLPYIGVSLVSLKDINATDLKELGIGTKDGVLVQDVLLGTPAFKAGVKKYDVITAVNGTAVKTSDELVNKIKNMKPGDKAALDVIRDGKKSVLTVTVGDKNDYQQQQQQ